MIGPIFDDSIFPDHWSTQLKKTLVSHIEDMIMIKEALIVLIRDILNNPHSYTHNGRHLDHQPRL